MAAYETNVAPVQINEQDCKRFMAQAVLLSLIDPVRGDAVRTLLDTNPEGDSLSSQQLKQKFLDSFALICSTSRSGKETASAVCLEQPGPAEAAILRVARNRGLKSKDLTGLEGVLQILRAVARKGIRSPPQAEDRILGLIAKLDRDRILSMAEKLETRGIRIYLQEARSRTLTGRTKLEEADETELISWLERSPFDATFPRTWSCTKVKALINWASQGRWHYPASLSEVLGFNREQQPIWLDGLHKIARYHSAVKSMVKLAMKQPAIVADIEINEVKAADQRPFALGNGKAYLQDIVKYLVQGDAAVTMQRLEERLGTHDVEGQLVKACPLKLTLHAEMQIVVFYEGNPHLIPRMRFIGTSKKACFLCYEYLLQHRLQLQASASHQKLYPTWMPPPYYPISGRFKNTPFLKLSRKVEQVTRRELRSSLTAARRPKNLDSTAGPSLTITATISVELDR